MISDRELDELKDYIDNTMDNKSMPGFGNMGNTCFANSVL